MNKQIFILGSGFGGIATLLNLTKNLTKNECHIYLISERDSFLFTPLLHEAATGELKPEHLLYPIKKFEAQLDNFKFIHNKVTELDLDNNKIITEKESFYYDYLVIALGSQVNFYGNENLKNNSFTLKNIADAIKIKEQILTSLAKANVELDENIKKALLTFAIAGAGTTGVELSGNLVCFIENKLKNFKNLTLNDIKIFLFEANSYVLSELKSPKVSRLAIKRLKELKINVLLNTKVEDYSEDKVKLFNTKTKSYEVIESKNFIWTAGIKVNSFFDSLKVNKTDKGKLIVDSYLNLLNYDNVFALGDNAEVQNESNWTTAQNAMQQGAIVAHNIYTKMNLTKKLFLFSKKYKYLHQGTLVTIGKNFGISDIFGLKISGLSGWYLCKAIHLVKINSLENKLNVFLDWFLNIILKRYN